MIGLPPRSTLFPYTPLFRSGLGGSPTVPPVVAAAMLGVPTVIHEQNGVMGRANRLLARWATMIATGFPSVRGIPEKAPGRVLHTGNPVRPAVIAAAGAGYSPVPNGGTMRLLVFGGSQGARVMGDFVPAAVERLPQELYPRLVLTQQARDEDLARVRSQYGRLLPSADVQPFFKDLPARIADAHL